MNQKGQRDRILIVDDDESVRSALALYLEADGYDVVQADSCHAGLRAFRLDLPHAVVLDYFLPDGDALALLRRFREIDPEVPVVVLSGHGSIDLAVATLHYGAADFLTKPVEPTTLEVVLARALEARRSWRRGEAATDRARRLRLDPFVGSSPAITRVAEQARVVAAAKTPVLLLGETGTGKGVLARWIHDHGPRRDESFVDLSGAGLTAELLESELFGHCKGAFTDAHTTKKGLLEVGHRGTIFLDEIGDMEVRVQAKVLKVLEENRFRALGGLQDHHVDVRLIAATHRDLDALVRADLFRRDLYYRINAFPIELPPLRERREDIPLLAEAVLAHIGAEMGRAHLVLAAEAAEVLQRCDWPGNVRELRNALEQAVLLAHEGLITAADLGAGASRPAASFGAANQLTLEQVEKQHITAVLTELGGNVAAASRRLEISRSALYGKMSRLGIALRPRSNSG
ncbi:MAG: sigma-54-dependent Fis family transcriptional regulator [Candidatus Schekmanbacteria bacterium]|nr:sigma-54-dependent Fis family transcriptional regulator [Candidatus Schekmanbacteria bacterium]